MKQKKVQGLQCSAKDFKLLSLTYLTTRRCRHHCSKADPVTVMAFDDWVLVIQSCLVLMTCVLF